MSSESATLSGPDQWTEPLAIKGFDTIFGTQRSFFIAVRGTFEATLTLQVSFDGGVSWFDTGDKPNSPTVNISSLPPDCLLRLGIAAGDYTSGSADVLLSQ